MEIKITGTAQDLQNIHQLIYQHDKNTEVDEEYGPNQGYQKEPLVAALITAGSSAITAIITNYIATKKAKAATETERYKIDKAAETERLRFYLKETRKWKELELKEIELLIQIKKQTFK